MRRSDPRSLTLLLAFLVGYLVLTGLLILLLRGLLIEERLEERSHLERRSALLEETMRVRVEQERAIITELMTVAGAQDFEEAYVMILAELEALSNQLVEVEARATTQRTLRLEKADARDSLLARVQALRLERDRLEANVAMCLERVASCADC